MRVTLRDLRRDDLVKLDGDDVTRFVTIVHGPSNRPTRLFVVPAVVPEEYTSDDVEVRRKAFFNHGVFGLEDWLKEHLVVLDESRFEEAAELLNDDAVPGIFPTFKKRWCEGDGLIHFLIMQRDHKA